MASYNVAPCVLNTVGTCKDAPPGCFPLLHQSLTSAWVSWIGRIALQRWETAQAWTTDYRASFVWTRKFVGTSDIRNTRQLSNISQTHLAASSDLIF